MKQRVISGVIGALILIAVLALGKNVLFAGVAIISFIAMFEYENAVNIKRSNFLILHNLICVITITYVVARKAEYIMPFMCLYVMILFVSMMASKGKLKLEDISKLIFGTMYIGIFFSHVILVRNMENGFYLIWAVFLFSFLTDIFAMLSGKFFGKHKIFPVLSPKKTVEGCIGGIIGSVVGVFILSFLYKIFNVEIIMLPAIILAISSSIISMAGDISASSIKRQFGIKDYGKIMPGHGGILDRFDSVLFVAPFLYYFLQFFPII